MDEEKAKISTTTDGKPADQEMDGAGAPKPINPATGQHGAYWVLKESERQKGFTRPLRTSYIHVGASGPANPIRDLTDEEKVQYGRYGYVKYEEYSDTERAVTGRFWTKPDLETIGKGCGTVTTMGTAIAETYARDPKYYGSTFCVHCRTHFPVAEFKWKDSEEVVGS